MFHRPFLQHLQWRAPAERWVLKAPGHLYSLAAIFETYPDAVIIQTHRDPRTVLASVASHSAIVQGAFADDVDPLEIGREVMHRWTNGVRLATEARSDPASPSGGSWTSTTGT